MGVRVPPWKLLRYHNILRPPRVFSRLVQKRLCIFKKLWIMIHLKALSCGRDIFRCFQTSDPLFTFFLDIFERVPNRFLLLRSRPEIRSDARRNINFWKFSSRGPLHLPPGYASSRPPDFSDHIHALVQWLYNLWNHSDCTTTGFEFNIATEFLLNARTVMYTGQILIIVP